MNKKRQKHHEFIDRNLKKDHQILIIFRTNVPDTTGHQMIVQVPTCRGCFFATQCTFG